MNHRFRVYSGLRDDPFYNNIKGLLGAYGAASVAIKAGAPTDASGCAHFDEATAKKIVAGRPYASVDDLAKAGVSKGTIEKLRSGATVSGTAPQRAPAAPSASTPPAPPA